MSNTYGDPAVLVSVLAMREQVEALRPQYEAAARAIEHLTALNDSVEQSLAAARAVDLAAERSVGAIYGSDLAEAARASIGNIEHLTALNDSVEQSLAAARAVDLAAERDVGAIYGSDLAEAARASIGNIAANIEALKANIDSRYGIDLGAVRGSLMANHDIGLDAVKASLAAAHNIDLEAMRAGFAGGLAVDLEAASASLAAVHDFDLAAMRASLAGSYGIDLAAVKESLASVHGIDFDDLTWPEELPSSAAGDAEHLDGLGGTSTNTPAEARDRADGGTSRKAWRVRRAWEVLQVLLTVDNFLGDPAVTALREAAGGASQAAQEVLLFLWLATIAQVPSPPPVPAIPVPETHTTPVTVDEGSLMDSDRLAERQPVTPKNGLGMIDRDEESSDGKGCDGSQ